MSDHKGKDNLNAIIARLDGVTPGPWRNGVLSEGLAGDPDKDAWSLIAKHPYGPSISPSSRQKMCRADFNHIARCDPDTMRSIGEYVSELEAERDEAQAQIAAMANVLERIAHTHIGDNAPWYVQEARSALESTAEAADEANFLRALVPAEREGV